MTKERIVLETSNRRKAALVEKLELQGDTLADWLEEQLTLTVGPLAVDSRRPAPRRNQPLEVLAHLQEQDWAFTNDDTGYLTHDLHPYPAKFIPQIPAHLIAALSVEGEVVLDPFGGSATTAVEAARMGRRALSLDANPLSELIGQVKTGFLTADDKGDLLQLRAAVAGPKFFRSDVGRNVRMVGGYGLHQYLLECCRVGQHSSRGRRAGGRINGEQTRSCLKVSDRYFEILRAQSLKHG